MALSATFTANFASFYDAVDKADVKLKDFGAGADKVGGRLTALGNSFSGVKLIQDATLMVKAVEDIGGASKLTEKELARLGTTTNEAVEKMKALGMEVPQNLQKIADQTKGATKATTDWAGSLTKAAGAVGIAFSVGAVVDFIGSVFDAASAVKDLSDQWGVSTTTVQQWTGAAKQSGVEAETVGKSVQFLTEQLGDGSDAYQALLKNVGLSYAELRKMPLEDAYKEVIKAIGGIKDETLQLDIAQGLLGTSSKKMVGAIRDGFLEAADAQKVMSAETIKRLEEAQHAWEKFKNAVVIYTGEMLAATGITAESMTRSWSNFFSIVGRGIADRFTGQASAAQFIVLDQAMDGVTETGTKMTSGIKTAAQALEELRTLGINPTADVLADLKRKEDAQKQALADQAAAAKKAADAAAEHLAKIRDLAAALSGVGLTQKTKDLNEAVALSALVYGRSALNTQATVDAVRALAREGAALPPLLRDIYLRHLDWAGAGVKVEVGIKSLLTDLPNYTQQLKNFMDVQFFNFKLPDFKTQIGNLFENLPNLAPQFRAWGKQNIENPMRDSAAAAANAMATELSIVDTVFGALGQHGGAAWKAAMQLSQIAVDGMIRYQNAITDADRETVKMQTTTAVATTAMTIGIDYMISQWLHYRAQINAARSTIADLQRQIADLGGEPIGPLVTDPNENPYFQKRIEDLRQQLKNLQTEQENARKAQEELNAAIQKYGLTFKDLEQGPVQALKILEDQFLHTFNALTSAGYKSSSVIHGMRDDLNDLIRTALDTRQQLPASFRPFLEQLIRSGDLADDVKRKLLGLADPAPWEDMKTAAEKYGIALGDLGPAFQQSKLDSMSKDLLADWDLLVTHGANVDAVIKGMSGKVNDLVHDSLKFGVDIPANMKPMLDAMVKAGTLTDDAGNKLTDLSSLHFAADLEADFDTLIQKLDELIDKLGGGGVAHPNSVAGAAEQTATDVENAFNNVRINPIHVPYVFDAENPPDFNIPGGGRTPSVPAMARGGIVTRPTFALIGEAGPEAVVPLGAGGALAPIYITVVSELDGREVARNQVRYIPNALRVAGI